MSDEISQKGRPQWFKLIASLCSYSLVAVIYLISQCSFYFFLKWEDGYHDVMALCFWGVVVACLFLIKLLKGHRSIGVKLFLSPLVLFYVTYIVLTVIQLYWLMGEIFLPDEDRYLMLSFYVSIMKLIVAVGIIFMLIWFWIAKDASYVENLGIKEK